MLITDRRGRVLIQHVDYRDACLLPGGAVDKGESPSTAAARELREELGVTVAGRSSWRTGRRPGSVHGRRGGIPGSAQRAPPGRRQCSAIGWSPPCTP
ncbi:NUDIX domain-containing protein [Streptomyces sp. NPDC014727]